MSAAWPSKALAEVCQIKPPKAEAKRTLKDADVVSFVPMEDLGIDQKFLEQKSERKLGQVAGSYTYFADGDVLLAKITPCFENGKLGIARGLTNGVGFGSSEYIVFRPSRELSNEYLYYFLLQDSFRTDGIRTMSGAVGHKRVSKEFVERCQIPLPPLPEQQRIVAILDEAFAGLATATANAERNLKNARELFESYLNSVFSEKTDNREETRLSEFCREMTVGHVGPMAKRYKVSGIPFLRSQNVRPFEIELDDVVYIDQGFHHELRKSQLRPGDVAIVRTGYPGTAAVIPDELKIANCADLVIVRCGYQLDPRYVAAFFNSIYGKNLVGGNLNGAAQKHFNVTSAKAVKIALPSRSEQVRRVEELEALRMQCRSLESRYKKKQQSLAGLKQSILQKAFSGELTSPPSQAIKEAAE